MKNFWRPPKKMLAVLLLLFLPDIVRAQEGSSGISMPFTLGGAAMHTHRLQTEDPDASSGTAGFRAMLYPSFKVGTHWFGFAAIQLRSEPYFFEETYSAEHEFDAQTLQAYLGYSWTGDSKSLLVKVGQLSSAFGSFLPRYDDAVNPLIDWPLSYGYYYKPVSLTGVSGVEIDATLHRLDARLQLTNSSPMHPVGLRSHDQHLQWAAGSGYTVRQGLRIGASAYRGPYMLRTSEFLSVADRAGDFPATGIGIDVQWAKGRWSANGEWQHFDFPYPRIPSIVGSYAYGEAKVILTPRWYAATRLGFQNYNYLAPDRQAYDFVLGYRVNRFQLVKAGYQWLRGDSSQGARDDVWAIQYVISMDTLQKVLR